MKIHLGVVDQQYFKEKSNKVPQARKGRKNKLVKPKVNSGEQSTGDVAEWLEKKYSVMQGFVDIHMPEISQMMTDSVQGAIESLMQGGSPRSSPFNSATSKIEKLFKFEYLDKEEIVKTGVKGVPTEAAAIGVNHRLLHPYAKGNPSRPSFIDTGLYQTSFKCWVEK